MADTSFWHPFADMGTVRSTEIVIDRGEDVWVWDTDGNRYFDGTASLWYCNVGHGRAEIAAAVAAQMRRLEAYNHFGEYSSVPARELAERLAAHAPVEGDAKVFLTSGGSDSVDTAFKIARRYWNVIGQPGRTHVISRQRSYHGTHGVGTAIAGIPANREGFGPLFEDQTIVPWDSVDAVADAIARQGEERVAAFYCEPVIGAGGVYPPPKGYVEGVAEVCRDAGVLFICDSVICAFGRLGTWFGIERWGVEPDMITFAKGVTSGYLPLGGVVASERVAEPFWTPGGAPMLRQGVTYAGHATCCAAALANLDILEQEDLIARGQQYEGLLFETLDALTDHPCADHARGGIGTMGALEIDAALVAEHPTAAAQLVAGAREAGVIVRPMPSAIVCSPPLTSTPEHYALLGAGIRAGLDALAGVVAA